MEIAKRFLIKNIESGLYWDGVLSSFVSFSEAFYWTDEQSVERYLNNELYHNLIFSDANAITIETVYYPNKYIQ